MVELTKWIFYQRIPVRLSLLYQAVWEDQHKSLCFENGASQIVVFRKWRNRCVSKMAQHNKSLCFENGASHVRTFQIEWFVLTAFFDTPLVRNWQFYLAFKYKSECVTQSCLTITQECIFNFVLTSWWALKFNTQTSSHEFTKTPRSRLCHTHHTPHILCGRRLSCHCSA